MHESKKHQHLCNPPPNPLRGGTKAGIFKMIRPGRCGMVKVSLTGTVPVYFHGSNVWEGGHPPTLRILGISFIHSDCPCLVSYGAAAAPASAPPRGELYRKLTQFRGPLGWVRLFPA